VLAKIFATTLAATLGMLALFLAATIAVIAAPFGADPEPDIGGGACVPVWRGGSVAGFRAEQLANAATIVAVGEQLHVPPQGWVVALTAALTESGLRNLNYGDRDSLGLFQQRPSQGWGTPTQILTPRYSATQFYRHLLALPHWQTLSANNAAQAVQRSATPTAYGPHEPAARTLLQHLRTVNQPDTGHTTQPTQPATLGPLTCAPSTPPAQRSPTRRPPRPAREDLAR
jgi:hypothetical protein